MQKPIRILFVGDVVGRPGRQAFSGLYPALRERERIDFCLVNAENAAAGSGITGKAAGQLLAGGADALTLGDHVWRKKEIFSIIGEERRIIRPANFPPGSPGRGSGIFITSAGIKIGVINILGRVFMNPIDCPFRQCDREIEVLSRDTRIIVVDFHAEATSEKVAMGYYCDGRISALIGTHTHIPTADERILAGGTAYITDIGMTAASGSILGREIEPVLKNFITRLPAPFSVSGTRPVLQGVIIEVDTATGKSVSIRRISEEYTAC